MFLLTLTVGLVGFILRAVVLYNFGLAKDTAEHQGNKSWLADIFNSYLDSYTDNYHKKITEQILEDQKIMTQQILQEIDANIDSYPLKLDHTHTEVTTWRPWTWTPADRIVPDDFYQKSSRQVIPLYTFHLLGYLGNKV